MSEVVELLKESLRDDEGLKLKPYVCTEGKLTIGYGRNLEARGIRKVEAEFMLSNDVHEVLGTCALVFPWFGGLSVKRQAVVGNMVYNLGMDGFRTFTKLREALGRGDWLAAAREMGDSKWAKQVGNREDELIQMMLDG